MPSHPQADHAAVPPGEPEVVDSLIRQTHRLRGRVAAVRRDAVPDDPDDQARWHRALYEFALRRLDEVGAQLGQLRDDLDPVPDPAAGTPVDGFRPGAGPAGGTDDDDSPDSAGRCDRDAFPFASGGALPGAGGARGPGALWSAAGPESAARVDDVLGSSYGPGASFAAHSSPYRPRSPFAADGGAPGTAAGDGERMCARSGSAEWNLLTDEVRWSPELYRIFGRTLGDGPLTLDELPSWLYADDQETLTGMVTGCLVDGRPINGEFRIVRPDGAVRAVHMVGEPVPDSDGGTASLWAVLRDVSELRRTQEVLRESRESLDRRRRTERTEHRIAVELQESLLPPWREPLWFPPGGGRPALDLAAHYLPCGTTALVGGDWYDAMQLPDGATLLTVGDLTGQGVTATTRMAMLLGAVRGLALAGIEPDTLMCRLNELLDRAAEPALASALCCRYDPDDRTMSWSQAGHPAPLLFRGGVGRVLDRPGGMLLGAGHGTEYGRRTERLRAGDVLLLHTDGLVPRLASGAAYPDPSCPGGAQDAGPAALLALGPRFAAARDAQECVRAVVEELGTPERDDDACVLIARVR
ncbi:SpoIIE family protein phosphatase [Streptomyces sp. SL13]|uniref:SpoIIE family protein phosphatase n=1 Tax=Streptantibioticus silvisoli TaxID=2705255 RepID=A0AA90KHN4_9ACTN|nr:SpoIIE family protein phosphatase [Streptantibioticus silvisoli]MDI5972090.1 SpoIIE family protein phosphatase [Streptantibioticus silvisoli]